MIGRCVLLGAVVLAASACGTTNAANPAARTTTDATRAAVVPSATMSPADMAAMASPAAAPTTAAAAPVVTTAPAPTVAAAVNAGAPVTPAAAATATTAPTTAPAPTSAPGPTSAPVPTTAPTATAAPAAPGTTVGVTLADTSIKLSVASIPAGSVTFTVTNGGTTNHEFVVLQTNAAQGALPMDPANPNTAAETGFLGKVPNLAPHATGQLTLTLGAGNYVVICNNPAHYMALGMHAALSVR